jgi:hypothetical protein
MQCSWLARAKGPGGMPAVLVLWNSCSQQFSPRSKAFAAAYGACRAYYYIVIDPLANAGGGLYRIRCAGRPATGARL